MLNTVLFTIQPCQPTRIYSLYVSLLIDEILIFVINFVISVLVQWTQHVSFRWAANIKEPYSYLYTVSYWKCVVLSPRILLTDITSRFMYVTRRYLNHRVFSFTTTYTFKVTKCMRQDLCWKDKISHLVYKFPVFYGIRKFITVFTTVRALTPFLILLWQFPWDVW